MFFQVPFSTSAQPQDPLKEAPRIIIYDPRKHISNPSRQLQPFDAIVQMCHDPKRLTQLLEAAESRQVFLLVIFSDGDAVEVRVFLLKYVLNPAKLHSLYIIFPNGVQFHDQWVGNPSIANLRWCRSFTTRLIQDICDACESSCNELIAFYRQRMIIAQDAVDRQSIDGADSVVTLYANERKKISLLLQNYLSTYS